MGPDTRVHNGQQAIAYLDPRQHSVQQATVGMDTRIRNGQQPTVWPVPGTGTRLHSIALFHNWLYKADAQLLQDLSTLYTYKIKPVAPGN